MAVKTRSMLKVRTQEIVKQSEDPLRTIEIHEIVRQEFPNVCTSCNRLSKYLQADKEINFDRRIKAWSSLKIKD